MMLVHKPHHALALASPASYAHRRHPSAPVVVQPTRTPGLLSLSKPSPPVRPSPSRQIQRQNPRPVAHQKKDPKPSSVVRAQGLTPSAEIAAAKKVSAPAAPATPSPQPRGRTQAKNSAKDKTARSVSRGKHARQPSPPQPQTQITSSQAEVPIKSTNPFDPFLDSQPNGKLAIRRQHPHAQASPSPALSKAIPVPSSHPRTATMARSEPIPSHMKQRPRPLPKRSSTQLDFPICDDLAEAGAGLDDCDFSLAPRRLYDSGPLTAPLSARSPGAFPFAPMASPPPSPRKQRNRHHNRTPSESIFQMSSDEELSTGPGGAILNPSVQALFGLVSSGNSTANSTPVKTPASGSPFVTPGRVTPPRTRESSPSNGHVNIGSYPKDSSMAQALFASSMFQNSPSPDELPDPLLL